MNVKDFIQKFLIEEIGALVPTYPFPAFVLMSIGVEFLGKCLRDNGDIWDTQKESRDDFENAINKLDAFEEYRHLVKDKNDSTNLYGILRCGLAHLYKAKYGIILSNEHNIMNEDKMVVIGCLDFYNDFRTACEQVLNDGNIVKKDLNQPYIRVVDSLTGDTFSNFETVSC